MLAKYAKQQGVSQEVKLEAEAVAKATQRPGQSKEQTKLIAQGIQKGIEEYKKRQKVKARELDKKLKKVRQHSAPELVANNEPATEQSASSKPLLPWVLLAASWLGFIGYFIFNHQ